jgi:integrase
MISKRNGVWHFDFTIEGHRFRGSCGTKDRGLAQVYASKEYGDRYRQIRLGERAPAAAMTLGEAFGRFRQEAGGSAYAEGAQQDHARAILGIISPSVRLADIGDDRIASLVASLRDGGRRGAGTINRHLSTLSAVCTRARTVWGQQVGAWTLRAHRQKEPPGRSVFLDYAQAQDLLDRLPGHAQGPVRFALLTGLRKDNVLGLRGRNISLDLRRLVLIQKGDRPLSVPLSDAAVDLLRAYVPFPPDGPVFRYGQVPCACAHCRSPANRDQPIRDLRTALATAARNAGLEHLGLRFHDLRHTFASWVLATTGSLPLASKALGHGSIRTTARYAHVARGGHETAVHAVAARLNAPDRERNSA